MGGFFYMNKWHPLVSATEIDGHQTLIKRPVIFADQMIDAMEQLQSLDNRKREYQ